MLLQIWFFSTFAKNNSHVYENNHHAAVASEKGGQGGQMPPHFFRRGGIAPLPFRAGNIAAGKGLLKK